MGAYMWHSHHAGPHRRLAHICYGHVSSYACISADSDAVAAVSSALRAAHGATAASKHYVVVHSEQWTTMTRFAGSDIIMVGSTLWQSPRDLHARVQGILDAGVEAAAWAKHLAQVRTVPGEAVASCGGIHAFTAKTFMHHSMGAEFPLGHWDVEYWYNPSQPDDE